MRFMLFSFPEHYPCGGMNDLVAEFDQVDELGLEKRNDYDGIFNMDYVQIYDRKTKEVINYEIKYSIMKHQLEEVDEKSYWENRLKNQTDEDVKRYIESIKQERIRAIDSFNKIKKWIETTINNQLAKD
jgi:hypothetical protein